MKTSFGSALKETIRAFSPAIKLSVFRRKPKDKIIEEKISALSEYQIPNTQLKLSYTEKDTCIRFENIVHLLNGFARIIEYSTTAKNKFGNFDPTIDPR